MKDLAFIFDFTNNDQFNEKIKKARDIGIRTIAFPDNNNDIKNIASQYHLNLVEHEASPELSADWLKKLIQAKQNKKALRVSVDLDNQYLSDINQWMHWYGHAINESVPSDLVASQGVTFENFIASYQKYLFINNKDETQVTISGLEVAPERVELIKNRDDLPFEFENGSLKITIPATDNWQAVRLQAHRPEDDLTDTQF
ncbi:MAG: hypothetical protein Q3960_03145 [Lactobacillus sp.]|nr:hypothetical protein [Lactobacillus sp.]